MSYIPPMRPSRKQQTTIYLNPDGPAGDIARTLRRELGELRFAHLIRAMAEIGNVKPTVLTAREQFDAIWRPI